MKLSTKDTEKSPLTGQGSGAAQKTQTTRHSISTDAQRQRLKGHVSRIGQVDSVEHRRDIDKIHGGQRLSFERCDTGWDMSTTKNAAIMPRAVSHIITVHCTGWHSFKDCLAAAAIEKGRRHCLASCSRLLLEDAP